MYRWVKGIISYRTFYIWRARYRYYTRNLDLWTLMSGLCIAGLLLVLWYMWRMLSVPTPRVHPETAALRIEGVTREAIHRIVLVRHAGSTPGAPFTTPEEVRASTLRTMRVRQVMDSEVVWRLKADMLADIADYITATGGCFPTIAGGSSIDWTTCARRVLRMRRSTRRWRRSWRCRWTRCRRWRQTSMSG